MVKSNFEIIDSMETLLWRLDLLYQALSGLQESSKINETDPEAFHPALMVTREVADGLRGTLDRLLSLRRAERAVAVACPSSPVPVAAPRPAPASKEKRGRRAVTSAQASTRA